MQVHSSAGEAHAHDRVGPRRRIEPSLAYACLPLFHTLHLLQLHVGLLLDARPQRLPRELGVPTHQLRRVRSRKSCQLCRRGAAVFVEGRDVLLGLSWGVDARHP